MCQLTIGTHYEKYTDLRHYCIENTSGWSAATLWVIPPQLHITVVNTAGNHNTMGPV